MISRPSPQAERQICFRVVARGQQSGDMRVEKVQKLPDQENGDADRGGDDDAREKVGAQAAEQARGLVWLDHPKTRRWPLRGRPIWILLPPFRRHSGPRCCGDRSAIGAFDPKRTILAHQQYAVLPRRVQQGAVLRHLRPRGHAVRTRNYFDTL